MQICKSLVPALAVLGLVVNSCQQAETDHTIPVSTQSHELENTNIPDSADTLLSYTYSVFETDGLGWGYKIFENGTLIINQPHIPAVAGSQGFSTSEKAEITAKFAIHKMELGFTPPTISVAELDSLEVLN
ncbi:MAG: DUF4907 domain-containing protein [Crocinitomicaceae bacterium]|nr:DUF4907 domain-containing protein [Crocinitomicaceae bacterium]